MEKTIKNNENKKDKVYIEIQYNDDTEFHFNVEVEGKECDNVATILMITRGTLMASCGTRATAYNEEGFEICAYTNENMKAKITDISRTALPIHRATESDEYKKKHGSNTIVLYELGAQCTAYGQSATEIAKATGRTIDHQGGIDIVTFPKTSEDIYLPRLVREGYKIAILEE